MTAIMPRGVRVGLGLALVLAGLLLALVPSGAQAATMTKTGWWWRVNDGTLPVALPTPPNVPEGGLMVAGAPDGATAIASLHFELNGSETSPVLTLTVADGGDLGGDTAIVAACLTGSLWEPASGGNWSFKPFPACSEGSVNGIRADDHAAWTFPVAPLVADGIVDVTLVPGVDPTQPEGANGSSFQLVFEAPTIASLATTPGIAPDTDFTIPDFGSPDVSFGGSGGFEVPAGGTLDLPAPSDSGFTAALPPSDQGLTATAPVAQSRNAPLAATAASSVAEHRGLAALVLVLCGAALLWSAQLPVPAPRRLGTFGGEDQEVGRATTDATSPALGGLGRFARTRTGGAPPL